MIKLFIFTTIFSVVSVLGVLWNLRYEIGEFISDEDTPTNVKILVEDNKIITVDLSSYMGSIEDIFGNIETELYNLKKEVQGIKMRNKHKRYIKPTKKL